MGNNSVSATLSIFSRACLWPAAAEEARMGLCPMHVGALSAVALAS
jgi:hypothetical protein